MADATLRVRQDGDLLHLNGQFSLVTIATLALEDARP